MRQICPPSPYLPNSEGYPLESGDVRAWAPRRPTEAMLGQDSQFMVHAGPCKARADPCWGSPVWALHEHTPPHNPFSLFQEVPAPSRSTHPSIGKRSHGDVSKDRSSERSFWLPRCCKMYKLKIPGVRSALRTCSLAETADPTPFLLLGDQNASGPNPTNAAAMLRGSVQTPLHSAL